jgi:hypothetical protein
MQTDLRVLDDSELDSVCGGMINLASKLGPAYHGLRYTPPNSTSGDTIDGIPFGQSKGDGSGAWGTANNNLPGSGWGN